MKRRRPAFAVRQPGIFLVGALLFAAAGVAGDATSPVASAAATPATDTALLALEARSLQAVCGSKCHTLAIVLGAPPASRDVWHDIVQKMLDRGAQASDDQLQDVMDYLHQTQTLVDVNAADADELQFVLNVSEAQARAIIARRTARKFSGLADLKSVAGLDAAALDIKARQITYQ